MTDESLHVRPTGSPTRCPFCHTDVEREGADWVACHACLAPHHAACWSEGGACANCGEPRCVGEEEAVAAAAAAAGAPPEDGAPVLRVELRGRRAHVECPASLRVAVRPGVEPELELRFDNHTDAPQRAALTERPPWLELLDDDALELPPGKSGSLRARVRDAAVLRRVRGARREEGRLVLGLDEHRRAVSLELVLHPAGVRARTRRLLTVAAVAGLGVVLFGGLGLRARQARIDGLATRGVPTQAVVTKLAPSNHSTLYYEYAVDGVRYEGRDHIHDERVGDAIDVTYLPEDPGVVVRGKAFDTVSGPAYLIVALMACLLTAFGAVLTIVLPSLPGAEAQRKRG